jgi:hypothetical protein
MLAFQLLQLIHKVTFARCPGPSGAVHSWRTATVSVNKSAPAPTRPMTGHVAPRAALRLVCRRYRLYRGLHRVGQAAGSALSGGQVALQAVLAQPAARDTAENRAAAGDQGMAGKRRGCV